MRTPARPKSCWTSSTSPATAAETRRSWSAAAVAEFTVVPVLVPVLMMLPSSLAPGFPVASSGRMDSDFLYPACTFDFDILVPAERPMPPAWVARGGWSPGRTRPVASSPVGNGMQALTSSVSGRSLPPTTPNPNSSSFGTGAAGAAVAVSSSAGGSASGSGTRTDLEVTRRRGEAGPGGGRGGGAGGSMHRLAPRAVKATLGDTQIFSDLYKNFKKWRTEWSPCYNKHHFASIPVVHLQHRKNPS